MITMPTDHAANKRCLAQFLHRLSESDGQAIDDTLAAHCSNDATWRIFHPFNDLHGSAEVAAQFWHPLRAAFADWEARMAFSIAGEYEGREVVSTWGVLMGNLQAPWLGIPPTHGLVSLR
ncbi:MAG: nuclear transport factor 2 family protein, partial [Rubrivivax sp.]